MHTPLPLQVKQLEKFPLLMGRHLIIHEYPSPPRKEQGFNAYSLKNRR